MDSPEGDILDWAIKCITVSRDQWDTVLQAFTLHHSTQGIWATFLCLPYPFESWGLQWLCCLTLWVAMIMLNMSDLYAHHGRYTHNPFSMVQGGFQLLKVYYMGVDCEGEFDHCYYLCFSMTMLLVLLFHIYVRTSVGPSFVFYFGWYSISQK